MIALTKYKVDISVYNIFDHLWMLSMCPEGATHRLWMSATVKGRELEWMQYFDEKRIKLQEMIKKGCDAFARTESKL